MKQPRVTQQLLNEIGRSAKEGKSYIHVIARGNKWSIKRHGAAKAYRIYINKEEAINQAIIYRDHINLDKVVVHDKNGAVEKVI